MESSIISNEKNNTYLRNKYPEKRYSDANNRLSHLLNIVHYTPNTWSTFNYNYL